MQSSEQGGDSDVGTLAESPISNDESVFNPSKEGFDSATWARSTFAQYEQQGFPVYRPGLCFQDLKVSGSGSSLHLQKTVLSSLFSSLDAIKNIRRASTEKAILHGFDGLLKSGELLLVLGRPGSGCSTFLKTTHGRLDGLKLDKQSKLQYRGISFGEMQKLYRAEVAYNGEVDQHFEHLTVGETLEFAGYARAPQTRINNMTRKEHVETRVQVAMAVFGLTHTRQTKVGNDFVRGVSGGERKRVSIAEMFLSHARVAAWDNSTRGLDAATALEFVKALRTAADVSGSCHSVAAYQASQAMYDVFDRVIVLYEGHQIFFGPCERAVEYFEEMGFEKPQRQVAGDFLSSITNPSERTARAGMENRVPRTSTDFEAYWKNSPDYEKLVQDISAYQAENPVGGDAKQELADSQRAMQAAHTRARSPYVLSVPMQIRLCIKRSYQRLRNDKASSLSTVISQVILSLIIGSVFYGTPAASAGFFQKGAVLFFAVLMNALITINEITLLYAQRPIVEKQRSYGFVHPFAEAFANLLSDVPIKFARCAAFSIILYFLVDLRREPSQFFIFFLFLFTTILTMSGIFRSLAAMTKSVGQAMAFAGVLVICMVVYTGFTLPVPYMHPWFSWIRWINPIFYAFESLIANEFHGRNFICSEFVPNYAVLTGDNFICSVTGAVAGQRTVSGDRFIQQNYEYTYAHVWRNYGILLAFLIAFTALYLIASELNNGSGSRAEFLIFRRGHVPSYLLETDKDKANKDMIEASASRTKSNAIPPQRDVFTWKDVCYEVPLQDGSTRQLLSNVSGWVKPGTLTALMGVSGAGKTTLLDVLAQRVSIGVVTGDMLVSGKSLDASFPRKTGYVQQQDLHLQTSTVREALQFSAMLRQPSSVSKEEKLKFVEEVITMLGMEDFSEAVVGQPGEGLNVEQRKLLTIGVELAAKPALLIFLDEPTSGLDSQSSWAICSFMRKLADHGQAVLSTIHQPSALLFQEFDRLLFLAKGGKTVYFGDIGKQSRVLLNYFEGKGARKCSEWENPAEYMLEIVGAGANGTSTQDWHAVWKASQEAQAVLHEIDNIHEETANDHSDTSAENHSEFAMPFSTQLVYVVQRTFQEYYRSPDYIFAKLILGIVSALFIGFSFWMPDSSQQGFQTVLFSLFLLCSIFSTLINQIMPKFVAQRALYEVRERPSKIYSWQAFILAQVFVELPWQILLAILAWASFYWSVFGANQSSERQGLVLLFLIQFYMFASTFAHLIIAALPDAATGGMLGTLMFGLTLIFNGVMQPPSALPGFWIFMYRVSPLTYYIGGIAGTALHGRAIECSDQELSVFNPTPGQTCGQYLATYLETAPGRLYNSDATSACQYCALSSADQYLAGRDISWDHRWRNYGIFWVYICFNAFGAIALYYVFRVRKWSIKSAIAARKQKKT